MKNELVSLNTPDASYRLILLHGWGADAEDLIPIGKILKQSFIEKLEVLSFRAPHSHPQGTGRQWYSLFPPDWSEVPSAVRDLKLRLKAIATKKLPLEKTVILGFSQGGAMALASGCNLPFAGLIGCSAYPHPTWEIPKIRPPIFLTHGRNDDVVPIEAMEKIIYLARKDGIESSIFNGGHEIPEIIIPRIIEVMKNWLI